MNLEKYLDIQPEIKAALGEGKPVVALESTILSHGMPYPENLGFAAKVEQVVRDNGAIPATMAILGGKLKVGLNEDDLAVMCKAENVGKVSRRDVPVYIANGHTGATTVATTMLMAEMVGIHVFATGGIGGLFQFSTNYRHITGDALAIAMRHHIEVEHINYIQIHPTTLYTTKPGRSFLISESVRGEGAYLYNKDGERFVNELLPRDVVSQAICKQMEKDGRPYVELSVTHLDPDFVRNRFPNIYRQCLEEGYDMTKEPIPVTPGQHYFMGGIKVNSDSETSMDGLYAAGETSCNGVHGRNRLASNSLLESLVFAERAANHIAETVEAGKPMPTDEIPFDPAFYADIDEKNRTEVLKAIKRKDEAFYDQWLDHDA